MKKTNLLKGALSVLAVSVLLASCTQVDSRIDTVDTLETPSVKAVAYPGVNYISWNAVKGAANYKVTRTVDGDVETTIVDNTTDLFTKDFLSVNDVDVEYKVYALSKSNPSRAVYVYDSNAGSASVTNIFPPVGTKAIDLPKYEKDSGWDFDEGADNKDWKDDFRPTAENIKVQVVDDVISVTAPTKAYLTTKVIGYTGTKKEILFYNNNNCITTPLDTYQNKTVSKKTPITQGGEWKFKVQVNAFGEDYKNAYYEPDYFELQSITIPSIETSKLTQITLLDYIDDAKTNARIEFMPAVSKDGATTFAVADYKVYRALAGSNDLVEVKDLKADSRTINGKTEVVYYVEDKVPSNKVAYDYYVVLSKDNKFESTNNSRRLETPNFDQTNSGWIGSWTFNKFDDDKLENDLVFEVGNNYSNTKIVSVAYAYSTTGDESKVLDTEYKSLTVIDEVAVNYNQQAFLVPNVPENNYVIVKAEFADKDDSNKTNCVIMGVSPKYVVADIDVNNFNVQISNPTQEEGDDDLLNNDWLKNKIKIPAGTELVSVKYATAKTVELAKTAALNSKDTVAFKVNDYKDGGYNWQYEFDINDKGKVGEYLAVAVEIKDENNKKAIYIQCNYTPVTINYNDCHFNISRTNKVPDGTTKNVTTLTADVSLYFNTSKNNVKNYGEACLYWIETNSSYEISPTAEWKSEKITIKPETIGDSATFTKSINITSSSYDNTKDTKYVDKFYVIKLVTKYTIDGAEEKEDLQTYQFNYIINK